MSNDRPQTEYIFDGVKVVIRDYITGFENEEIVKCYQTEKSVSERGEDAERKAAVLVLVSVNGSTENLYDSVMNLPLATSIKIKNKMKEILNPISEEAEKKE